MIEKIKTWIAGNKTAAIIIGAVVALFMLKKVFRAPRKKRRRSVPVRTVTRRRRVSRPSGSKKAWQVKGSPAARARMARLRRMRKRKLI